MNFVLGKMLGWLPGGEEEAFWVFAMLLERVLPLDYYFKLLGVNSDCHFLSEELIKIILPEIYRHFKKLKYHVHHFALNWFLCLFQDKLSDRLSLAILDLIFIHGSSILLNVALAILYVLKPRILQCEDFGSLWQLMEEHQEHFQQSDAFKEVLALATLTLVPKDLKIPSDMARYARDKRVLYANVNLKLLKPTSKIKVQIPTRAQVAEKLQRNALLQDKLMKQQHFYMQFYLLNGLSKLRGLKDRALLDDLFKNLTESVASTSRHEEEKDEYP